MDKGQGVVVLVELVQASRGGYPRRWRRRVLGRYERNQSQRCAWRYVCRRVGGWLVRYVAVACWSDVGESGCCARRLSGLLVEGVRRRWSLALVGGRGRYVGRRSM